MGSMITTPISSNDPGKLIALNEHTPSQEDVEKAKTVMEDLVTFLLVEMEDQNSY